jgi:hypothetical protein
MENSRTLDYLDVLASLSLANLVLLEVWRKLIFVSKFFVPYWSWRDLLSSIIMVAIFTGLFLLTIRESKQSRHHELALHRLIYLLPILLIFNFLRRHELVTLRLDLGDSRLVLMGSALIILLIAAFARWHRYVLRVAEIAVIGLVGFIALTFGQATRATLFPPPIHNLAPLLSGRPASAPRVVWIIFDEMDWRYTFGSRRPANLKMPEFERLKAQSFYGVTVHQAGLNTITAMPSLITGKTVYYAKPADYSQLMLHFRIDEVAGGTVWGSQETLFSSARKMGLNVGVVGWYIPYCRVFYSVLSECMWESLDSVVRGAAPSLRTSFTSQMRTLSPAEKRQRHIVRYSDMMAQANLTAADPQLGLVLLHMPVPHGPPIYDAATGRLTPFTFSNNWYLGNLALTDRALGEIRASMERAGVWDNSTVLVSADHALRRYSNINETMDSRVPYLLKLAGQKNEFDYQMPFHALITRDLILAILGGKLSQPQQVAEWIAIRERQHPAITQTAAVENNRKSKRLD